MYRGTPRRQNNSLSRHSATRLGIAERLGANVIALTTPRRKSLPARLSSKYDVVVEASSRKDGVDSALRLLNPGGICTAIGYYLAPGTKIPMMHMYANCTTLKVGVSNVRPVLPDLLDFVARESFPAEAVATMTADWDDAPAAFKARTTKLVLYRPPLGNLI